jgi:hypothetical protein
MDFSKEKRKIKALGVMEKIQKFKKLEILNEYHEALGLKNSLTSAEDSLRVLAHATEKEISESMQKNPSLCSAALGLKNEFLNEVYMSQSQNRRYLAETTSETLELLTLLSTANAHQNLVANKYEVELTHYKKEIIAKCEAK